MAGHGEPLRQLTRILDQHLSREGPLRILSGRWLTVQLKFPDNYHMSGRRANNSTTVG